MNRYKPRTYTINLDPTEGSKPPHKRVLTPNLDPTEYSRKEYDRKLKQRGINPEPWVGCE